MKLNRAISMDKWMLMLLISNIIWQVAGAQEASFTASVSKNRVVVGEQFQVSFTINTNASNFNAPDFSNFITYSGPAQSSSTSIINGSVSQTISINYILAAKNEGKFTIGAASIKVGNKVLTTKPFTVEVTKANAQSQQQGSNRKSGNNSGYPEDVESNIFMKASVNKSKVYQGEQLLVTYRVYFRVNIVDYGFTKAPSFNGFWNEELTNPARQLEIHSEVIDGIEFKVAELKRTVLIPQRSGTLTIDPLELDVVVRVKSKTRSNNIFDNIFGGGYQDVKLSIASKPVKTEVMPLPAKGRPENFNGAVGQLNIEAGIKNNEIKTDEGCNLTYTVSGKGNLKLLEAFKLKLPADIETYDPKITDKISVTADGVKGSRTFDYLLIPRYAGTYAIPALPFSYFDPQKGEYITINGPDFQLKVAKGAGGDGMSVSRGTEKEEVKQIGSDIRYIKTNKPLFIHKHNALFGSAMFWILFICPGIVYLLFLIWLSRYKKENADHAGTKKRKANSMAQKQLKAASVFLQKNDYNAFFEEVFKALYGYIGSKLVLNPADLNKEKIKAQLFAKGIDETIINQLHDLLEVCEFARFAPVKDEKKMKEAYDKSVELISILESKLKKSIPKSAVMVFILGLSLFSPHLKAADNQALYTAAQHAYQSMDYPKAISLYQQILASEYSSSEVFFNLGNAYFKTDSIGRSIQYYEKARKIVGDEEDLMHNLKMAHSKTVDKIEPMPEFVVTSTWKNIVNQFSADSWANYTLINFALVFVALMLFHLVQQSHLKKTFFSLAVLLVLLSGLFYLLAKGRTIADNSINQGVLILTSASVKSAPQLNSTDIFVIHEGTVFKIIEQQTNWIKIRLDNGNLGWIQKNAIGEI